MEHESLDNVVSGVLFDFGAFLTGRKEMVICSTKHNASPMIEALKDFMTLRGVNQDYEPMTNWPILCKDGKIVAVA